MKQDPRDCPSCGCPNPFAYSIPLPPCPDPDCSDLQPLDFPQPLMREWENKYPLDTFKGETKKELVTFIHSIIAKAENRTRCATINYVLGCISTYKDDSSSYYLEDLEKDLKEYL